MDNIVRQGSWVQYGEKQTGEPLYWSVTSVFDNDTILGRRYNHEEELIYREINKTQYTLVTDEALCRKLSREFVGADNHPINSHPDINT